MSNKKPGWENKLTEYVASCVNKPFRPGRLDCGLFFSGAVKAMTGKIVDKPFRGKYRTIAAAMKIANDLGYDDHVEYFASIFETLPSPLMARRGDGAVVIDMNGSPAMGVVQGEHIYVMGLQGVGLAPLTDAIRAFRV